MYLTSSLVQPYEKIPRGGGGGVRGGGRGGGGGGRGAGKETQLVSFFPHPSQFLPHAARVICSDDKMFLLINSNHFFHIYS